MVGEPRLRVGLAQQRTDAAISLKGAWRLGDQTVGPSEGLRAQQGSGKVVLTRDGSVLAQGPSLILEPGQPDSSFVLHRMTVGVDFHWQHEQDLSFYGGLELASRGAGDSQGSFDVINAVGLETYLRSVISSEMAATCPDALLRAHAVISRSWLLAMLEGATTAERSATAPTRRSDGVLELVKWYDREDHQHFDVCADDHCQRYQGISRTTTQAAVDAVDATRGLVLAYGQDQVVDARFSKACGGMTEVFESAWGDTPVPYLQAFLDHDKPATFALPLTDEANASAFIAASPPAFCNCEDKALLERVLPALDHGTTRFYRWQETVTSAEVRQYVQNKLGIDLGEITELTPLMRGPSGRIVRLAIVGEKDTLHVGKELEIRKLLSKSHLYSSGFVVRAEGEGASRRFHLRGAGWGHGVGLCQIGAAVMADQGYTHEAILEHYYRGARLEQRY